VYVLFDITLRINSKRADQLHALVLPNSVAKRVNPILGYLWPRHNNVAVAKVPTQKSLYSSEYESFLDLLRAARETAGLTQNETARLLKRPQSFVSKCESGERRVDVVELSQICRVYGISAGSFLKKLS
jgi:hypothetical protein